MEEILENQPISDMNKDLIITQEEVVQNIILEPEPEPKTIIEDVKNPQFVNLENTVIDCELKLNSFPNYLSFSASPLDSESYSREVYQQCLDGVWGEVLPFQPPSRDAIIKQKTAEIMLTRDKHSAGGVFAFNHWWPTNLVAIPQWNYLRDMAREIKYDGGDMEATMTDIDNHPFSWQTLDNGDVSVTANMVIAITDAGARNINKNAQNAKRHIVNLNASEHPEDYDFSDGWTEIYQG